VVRKEPPRDLAPVIGDSVHNLRSALDHLVYELSSTTVREKINTQFPIFTDERDYRKRGEPMIRDHLG